MDYLPPGLIQRINHERFPRFIIRDGLGQFWAGEERRWSDKPGDAVLFYRELDAITERNWHCLGDAGDTFTVTVSIVTHAGRWSLEELVRHLRRHRRFFTGGPAGKEGIALEILPDSLKKVEP